MNYYVNSPQQAIVFVAVKLLNAVNHSGNSPRQAIILVVKWLDMNHYVNSPQQAVVVVVVMLAGRSEPLWD